MIIKNIIYIFFLSGMMCKISCPYKKIKWIYDDRILFYTNNIEYKNIHLKNELPKTYNLGNTISIDSFKNTHMIHIDSQICKISFISDIEVLESSIDKCAEFQKYYNSYLIGNYISAKTKDTFLLILVKSTLTDSVFYTQRLYLANFLNNQIKSIVLVATDDYTPFQRSNSYTKLYGDKFLYYESYYGTDTDNGKGYLNTYGSYKFSTKGEIEVFSKPH